MADAAFCLLPVVRLQEPNEFSLLASPFVQYEQFVADEMAYFDTIPAFYLPGASHGGTEKPWFDFQPFTPQKALNPLLEEKFRFRNARVNKRHEVFTRGQLESASAMMLARLLARFARPPSQQSSL